MTQLRSTVRRIVVAGVMLAALLPSRVYAQQAPAKKPSALVSINPLALPFGFINGESESRITNMLTIGSSITWWSIDNVSLFSIDAKLRIYPNEEAFKGFSIGFGAGAARLSEDQVNFDSNGNSTSDTKSAFRPTIGVFSDYNWLLGKNKRFLVGAGVGAKRIFGTRVGFRDVNFAYPTARFQTGVVF